MSSFFRYTVNPKTKKWELAHWIDDYFGHYQYGVEFSDGEVYDPYKTSLRQEITEQEANFLNGDRLNA